MFKIYGRGKDAVGRRLEASKRRFSLVSAGFRWSQQQKQSLEKTAAPRRRAALKIQLYASWEIKRGQSARMTSPLRPLRPLRRGRCSRRLTNCVWKNIVFVKAAGRSTRKRPLRVVVSHCSPDGRAGQPFVLLLSSCCLRLSCCCPLAALLSFSSCPPASCCPVVDTSLATAESQSPYLVQRGTM